MQLKSVGIASAVILIAFSALLATPAQAQLVLSQLVVELVPGEQDRADIEILNKSPDRSFVAIEPREVIAPGTAQESKRTDPDPEKLGLLVSPERLVLEPGEHRLIRIAALGSNSQERVYRVRVEPVVGQLSSSASGLKILVGYDVLVLVRPSDAKPHVSGTRSGQDLRLVNDGNVSVELTSGRACDAAMRNCKDLPGGRLYAGAAKSITIGSASTVQYKLKLGPKLIPVAF